MKISSPDFKEKEKFPTAFTGDGANVSPPLIIEDVPDKAKSLVLFLEDPDSEKVCGHSWIHWLLYNIPADKKVEINKNSYLGLRGKNDYGKLPYGGPLPPRATGAHHYYFKVFALDCELDLGEGLNLDEIKKKMENRILDKAEFFGVYWRD